jgi:hypothetical protein
MEIVPITVGDASRAWDERHLDLESAARQVARAATNGFTSAVSGAAARFTGEWKRHLDALATGAEGHADGLRGVIATYLQAEGVTDQHFSILQSHLREVR